MRTGTQVSMGSWLRPEDARGTCFRIYPTAKFGSPPAQNRVPVASLSCGRTATSLLYPVPSRTILGLAPDRPDQCRETGDDGCETEKSGWIENKHDSLLASCSIFVLM